MYATYFQDYFEIDNTTGRVSVRSNDSLPDREVAERVVLTVMVQDLNAYHPAPQTATGKCYYH